MCPLVVAWGAFALCDGGTPWVQVQRGVIPLGSPGSTRSSRLQFARWQSQETKRLIDGAARLA